MSIPTIVVKSSESLQGRVYTPSGAEFEGFDAGSPEEAARKLTAAVPPKTASSAYVVFERDAYQIRKDCIEALEKVGYTNITAFGPEVAMLNQYLAKATVDCEAGEVLPLIWCPLSVNELTTRLKVTVLQKCEGNGFKIIESNEINFRDVRSHIAAFSKLVLLFDGEPAPAAVESCKRAFSVRGKNIDVVSLNDSDETKVVWNHLNNVEKQILEICSFDFQIRYVQNGENHVLDVSSYFEAVPFRKLIDVDAEKGKFAALVVRRGEPESSYSFEIANDGLTWVTVVITVGVDLLPRFEITREKLPVWASLFMHVLTYHPESNNFTGTIVKGIKVQQVATNVTFQQALAAMDKVTGMFTMGILIDYNQHDIPWDIHRAIAPHLTDYPKVQIAPLHSWLTLCLAKSGIHCENGESVGIIDWRYWKAQNKTEIVGIIKMVDDQFHLYPPSNDYTKLLILAKTNIANHDVRNFNKFFHNRQIHVVNYDQIDPRALFEYAWYDFTSKIGPGYVVKSYCGLRFKVDYGGECKVMDMRFLEGPGEDKCRVAVSKGGGNVEVSVNCFGSRKFDKVDGMRFASGQEVEITVAVDRFFVPKVVFSIDGKEQKPQEGEKKEQKLAISANLTPEQPSDDQNAPTEVKKGLQIKPSKAKTPLLTVSTHETHHYQYSTATGTHASPYFKTYAQMYAAIKKEFPDPETVLIVDTCEANLPFEDRHFRYALQQRLGYLDVTNVTQVSFVFTMALVSADFQVDMDTELAAYDGQTFYLLKRATDGLRFTMVRQANSTFCVQFMNSPRPTAPNPCDNKVLLFAKVVEDKKMLALFEKTLKGKIFVDSSHAVPIDFITEYVEHVKLGSDFNGCLVRDFMRVHWAAVINNFNGPYYPNVPTFATLPFSFDIDAPVGDGKTLRLFADFDNEDSVIPEPIEDVDVTPFQNQVVRVTFKAENAYKYSISAKQVEVETVCEYVMPFAQSIDPADINPYIIDPADINPDINKAEDASDGRFALIARVPGGIEQRTFLNNGTGTAIECFKASTPEAALQRLPKKDSTFIVFDVSHANPFERESWYYAAVESGLVNIQFTHALIIDLENIVSKHMSFDCPLGDHMFLVDAIKFKEKPVVYVLQRLPGGFRIKDCLDEMKPLREAYPFINRAWIHGDGDKVAAANPAAYRGFLWYDARGKGKVLSEIEERRTVNVSAGLNFIITYGDKTKTVHAMFEDVPYKEVVPVFIGQETCVEVHMMQFKVDELFHVNTFNFPDVRERIIVLEFSVDDRLHPSVKMLGKEILVSMVLTFTNNRILVRGYGYDGLCLPAYVSFKDDDFTCGEEAEADLELHPDLVVYDIVDMLAYNFDLSKPYKWWRFKVHRDDTDQIAVTVGGITTYAETLFGLLIKMVVKQLRKGPNDFIRLVGIQVPHNVQVSQELMDVLSRNLGVELQIINF